MGLFTNFNIVCSELGLNIVIVRLKKAQSLVVSGSLSKKKQHSNHLDEYYAIAFLGLKFYTQLESSKNRK
jgi:hypothetical protein